MAIKDNLDGEAKVETPQSRRLFMRRIGMLAVSAPLALAVLQACGGEEAEPTAEPEEDVVAPEETEEATEEPEETEEPTEEPEEEDSTPVAASPVAEASPVAASPVAASPVPEPPFAGTPIGSPMADEATPVN